ncbi:hypothetical protein Q3G72_015686 [Acer saccharum]|nr:hypothetical protein Q3G72_015686 [Acer saccharum]
MAFSAILRKSASSLVPTESRLVRANRNFYTAVFSASGHLNRKPSLGSFVPDFEFSSATETKKCSSNESLLQSIESELKRIGHVEETSSEFTFELNRDFNKWGRADAVLTKKFKGELVEVSSSYLSQRSVEFTDFTVTIYKHGYDESPFMFYCSYTPDEISISDIELLVESDDGGYQFLNLDLDENLKKAFQKYLEVRGIKPSFIEYNFKCIRNKYTQINLTVLKKIKNFIEQPNGPCFGRLEPHFDETPLAESFFPSVTVRLLSKFSVRVEGRMILQMWRCCIAISAHWIDTSLRQNSPITVTSFVVAALSPSESIMTTLSLLTVIITIVAITVIVQLCPSPSSYHRWIPLSSLHR